MTLLRHVVGTTALWAALSPCFVATAAHAWSDDLIEGEEVAPAAGEATTDDAPPPAPEKPTPRSILARNRDASIDRGLTTGHAENVGAGKWTINDYQIIFFGVTYGFTDDFQLSLSTLLPITTDLPLAFALSPKYVVSRGESHALAIRGNVWFAADIGSGFGLGVVTAGPVFDYYFDAEGRYAFHAGASLGGAFGGDGDDFGFGEGLVLSADLGFTLGVAKNFKILFETQMFATYTRAGFNVTDIALFNYGVRFHGEGLAVDLAFLRPIGDIDVGPLLLGVPYITFSARF
jgi:hypothetical protein